MQYVDDVMSYFENKDNSESKNFLLRILSKWRLFLLCGLIGAGLAVLVYNFLPKVYSVRSSIFVHIDPNENKAELLFQKQQLAQKSNIQNNVELLKAFTLNREAIANLEWNVSWYKKGIFTDEGLYKKSPFVVKKGKAVNVNNVPIRIQQINDNQYRVIIDYTAKLATGEQEISVDETATFGVPFVNEFFNFTIDKKNTAGINNSSYYFVFNDIDKLALRYMKKTKISVSDEKAEFIHLLINCREVGRGIDFLNELTNVYLQFSLYEKNKKSEHTVQFIDSQLAGVANSLENSGKKFSDFKSENRIVNIGEKGAAVAAKIQLLESELAQNKLSLKYYQNLLSNISEKELASVRMPSVAGVDDQAINTLVGKLIDLNSRRKKLSFSVQDDNPKLKILDNEINFIIKSLGANLTNLVASSNATISSLSARIAGFKNQLTKLPRSEQAMNSMKVKYNLDNELYTFLMKKRAEAAIAKASTFSDSQVIDPASMATTKKMSPKLLFNLLVGLFLGIAIPFVIFLVKEFFDDTIRSENDLMTRSKLPIIANIKHSNHKDLLPIINNSRSSIAESIRTLRTGLKSICNNDSKYIIGMHSALPNEGKTFIACNLAASVAISNKKVLLIGADMRKHNVSDVFEPSGNYGLSDYLSGDCDKKDIVFSTDVENLDCIVTVDIPENPVELLENGKLEDLLLELKQEYDFIFIDNAPLMVVADGYSTAKISDINLFVFREGKSQKREILYLNHLVKNKMIDKVMLVLNDATHQNRYSRRTKVQKYYVDRVHRSSTQKVWDALIGR